MNPRGPEYVHRLRAACQRNYVVGSFNLDSLDVLGQLANRAALERSPIIFQFGPWSVSRLSIGQIGRAARGLLDGVPGGFVHLDHCTDEAFIRQSLDAGFDSAMFDGTALPLEENTARTRAVVEMGHNQGAAVEGAVGVLEKGVDTDVATARRFVEETGVDALGVAVGTGHGQDRQTHQIDVVRLRELSAIGVPLVIHGGSGLPPGVMAAVRNSAVAKINVATALFRNCRARIEQMARDGELPVSPGALVGMTADAFWEVVRERLERFGCLGKEA